MKIISSILLFAILASQALAAQPFRTDDIAVRRSATIGTAAAVGQGLAVGTSATVGTTLNVSGSAAIGTASAPNSKAVLDLVSTTKGFLAPRMTQTQRDAITSPTTGLQIFNTDSSKLNVYNGTSWQDVGSGSGGGAASLLLNTGFEDGTINWTATNGTLAPETTNKRELTKSLKLSFAAQTGDVSQSITPSVQVDKTNMEASCWIKTALTTIQVCSLVGGLEQQCISVPSDSTWYPISPTFTGQPSGTIGVKVKTTASTTGDVYIDDCYVGANRGVTQVSQSTLVGGVVITGCASAHSSTATSFTTLGTQTGCVYTPFSGSGTPQAPGTNVVGVKFPTLGAGEYVIEYEGVAGSAVAAKNAYFKFTDGTVTARETSVFGGSTSTLYGPGIRQTFAYTAPQTNVTLHLLGMADTGGNAQAVATTAIPGTIRVYRYPTTSEAAARISSAFDSTSMLVDMGSSGCPSNSIAADGSAISRAAYSKLFAKIGTTYGVGDGSTTFNLPNAQGVFIRGAGSQTISTIVYSGTQGTTQGDQLQGHIHGWNAGKLANVPNGAGRQVPYSGGAAYDATGGISSDAPSSDGTNGTPRTGAETRPANIVMKKCMIYDGSITIPLVTNSVTTGSAGVERIERVSFGGATRGTNNCTSTPCTRYSYTPGVTGVTRSATGTYVIAFAAGTFSDTPTCSASGHGLGVGGWCSAAPVATDSATQHSAFGINTGGAATDVTCDVVCMGPK